MTRRKFPLWLALGAVLVVALVAGSGVLHSAPPTPAQRAAAIEREIKCPSCEDLSVANSTAQTAVIVRGAIKTLIAEGRTDQQIRDYLAARYGSQIVLVPPASGWSLLVWVLPVVGGAAAVTGLVVLFVRRRRTAELDPEQAAAAEAEADADADAEQLAERLRFLEASLADAEAEHGAGDLSEADYLVLRSRDTARLATLRARLEAASSDAGPGAASGGGVAVADRPSDEPAAATEERDAADRAPTPDGDDRAVPAERPRRSRRQRVLLGGTVAAFGTAVVLVVALFAANRLPGQTATGNATLSRQAQISQDLAQAATLVNQDQPGEAAQLYQQVLDQQPKNEVALAQLGWLEFQTGQAGSSTSLLADARSKLDEAVQLAPGDYAARLYLGTVLLLQDHDAAGAVAQYQAFLKADPPADLIAQAATYLRQAYAQAGQPLPSQVPAS